MKCPGQDTQTWKPGDIFDWPCPACGEPIEFFKDDSARTCRACGYRVKNPRLDLGCASWCPHGKQCLAELGADAEGTTDADAQGTTGTDDRGEGAFEQERDATGS